MRRPLRSAPRPAGPLPAPLLPLALVLLGLLAVGASRAGAGPEGPAGPPAYANEALGVSLRGPAGWKMAASRTTPSVWAPLVTFFEPASGTEATLHVRSRRHDQVPALQESVMKEFAADRTFTVVATRVIEPSPGRPLAGFVVEATQQVAPPKPAPGAKPPAEPGAEPGGEPGAAPPAGPATMYVMATYWLAPGYEYLLYAQAKNALWSRMRPFVEATRDSFAVAAPAKGPEGEGAYQDEARGYSLRFPKGYTVRIPSRRGHVAEFAGVSADDPVLGVYHFASGVTAEQDAKSLATYYADEQGGDAVTEAVQVSGVQGVLVKAHAAVGGRDQAFFVAVAKRGGEVFRFRCACPKAKEADGRRVFDAFLASVAIGVAKAPASGGSPSGD